MVPNPAHRAGRPPEEETLLGTPIPVSPGSRVRLSEWDGLLGLTSIDQEQDAAGDSMADEPMAAPRSRILGTATEPLN